MTGQVEVNRFLPGRSNSPGKRQMLCPSCGGEVETDSRFAHLVVCQYCSSAIILDEEAARVSGKMSVLAQTPSPFFVGGTGALSERRFTVLGRVRYGYAKGYWDEWFLGFEDGSMAWISEDEDNFTLESCEQVKEAPAEFDSVRPGDLVRLGDTSFHVDEKDEAECEGGEGQLPFAVLQGEKVPFIDLSIGDDFATVEYEEEGAKVFRGRRLDLSEVAMDQTAEEAGVAPGVALAAERAAAEGKRERVVRREDRAKGIRCYTCGAPLEIPDLSAESMTCQYCGSELDLTLRRISCPGCGATVPVHGGSEASSVVCSHCQSQLDITREEPSVLASLVKVERPRVPFSLGSRCAFHGKDYLVVGHIRYMEKEGSRRYYSDEFLLHSKKEGYHWLIMEDGHFSLCEEVEERPAGLDPRHATPGSKFRFLGRKWAVFDVVLRAAGVVWVDGELPWVAKVNDLNSYMDAVSPPYTLTAEWTETEMEWYRAEYLTHKEVAAAFRIPESKLPTARGIAPNQPYTASAFRRQSAWVMGLFAVVFVFLMVNALTKGRKIAEFTVNPNQYAEEFLSEPFQIESKDALCKASFSSAVDNSWVYLDVAVVNSEEKALLDFSAQMSYYHGYEGGESWSEGSRDDSTIFKLKGSGEYRLLMFGQAGTSNAPGDTESAGRSVQVKIYEGVVLMRYHLIAFLVCCLVLVVSVVRRAVFEARRWAESGLEADDD